MAIDSDFVSLLQSLMPEDPFLPPKPWESIPSEGGGISAAQDSSARSSKTLYDPFTISEAMLVRLVMNALQGVKSALDSIELLSASFCSIPADRTFHRIPCLWHRSSSTNSLGKILKSIGHSGHIFFHLRKFVDYFLGNLNLNGESRDDEEVRKGQISPELAGNLAPTVDINHESEMGKCPPYGLVNQAFCVAVGKVLDGYLCALNTLFSSVKLRHSKNVDMSAEDCPEVGSLTSVVHSEVSVMEAYLHTKELRTHIEALGNICFAFSVSSRDNLTTETSLQFYNFPKGADLLTFLYVQLRDADPVHRTLLKFLFVRACEPYCGLVKSWIYQASVNDPYKEFIVECFDDSSPSFYGRGGYRNGSPLPSIKERGVSIPCFLKDVNQPLLRAGQQLQVLIKLLDMCNCVTTTDKNYGRGSQLLNLEDILPYWNGSISEHISCLFPLAFSRRDIEAKTLKRETMYRMMQEKLENLLPRLSTRCWMTISNEIQFYNVSFHLDEGLTSLPSTSDEVSTKLAADAEDEDASRTSYDFSYENEDSLSSECSSLTSSEEQIACQRSVELHEISVASITSDLSNLGLSNCVANHGRVQQSPESERLWSECVSDKNCEGMNPATDLSNLYCKDTEMILFSTMSLQPRNLKCTPDSDVSFGKCWPLGGLLKNPFSVAGACDDPTHLRVADCCPNVTNRSMKTVKIEDSNFDEGFGSNNFDRDMGMGKMQLDSGKCKPPFNTSSYQSWDLRHKYNLSLNPVLTRNSWFHMTCNSSGIGKMSNRKCLPPHFDFSSVKDPCGVYGESLHANPDFEFPKLTRSGVSAVEAMSDCANERHPDGRNFFVDEIDQSVLRSADPSRRIMENSQEEPPASVSGGAKWESLLSHSIKDVCYAAEDVIDGVAGDEHCSMDDFEIPLDVIVEKCVLQDILLQYKYVSYFTIKLLEEGFDLRGHLLALRRYHFMEIADWADSFITSLWHHKWNVAEPSQRLPEIQSLLDLALQRSSCESHHYKERLFVYMKDQGMMSTSSSVSGVHAFDYIALGYRVDWPVSIVLTPDALKTYAEIFSFLTQIRLAVFSLTDIWLLLKGLMSQDSAPSLQEKTKFNALMKMRQQVNHFVSTLQQYVQSQLSHVSWCWFLNSLKHQVKDMLDLESVHMAYLADALHICFLSDETRHVASFIENILQCALDFRFCFAGSGLKAGSRGVNMSELLAQINLSQVLTIKTTFEENLKELYLCYLKSPKHSEFVLCRFWEFLNYNDYFSNVISKATRQGIL